MSYGGIEAGGTKWVCAIGDGDGRLLASETFPTGSPSEAIARTTAFFLEHGPPRAIGIGCFGPVDIRPASPTFGYITTTPKPGWGHTDVVTPLRAALGVPIALDTDVNAAAIGEARWGRGRGLDTFAYVTVGTGIGVGAIANGSTVRGLLHPEAGHIRIPHDCTRDPFAGSCPYHGDCFEGLASGEALRQRWGRPAEELRDDHRAWDLEADYLALGFVAIVHILAPQRLLVGGGVARRPNLLPRVRTRVRELVGGYLLTPELLDPVAMDDYIVAPELGDRAGVLGAIELGRTAAAGMLG